MSAVPLTLPIPVAGALLGLSHPSAYRLASRGGFPLAKMPGKKRVVTAEFERMFGQPITAERYAAAVEAAVK